MNIPTSKALALAFLAIFLASPAFSAGKLETIGGMLPREDAITNAPKKKAVYTGNVKTKKYHAPGCKFYDCRDCSASFKSQAEAVAAGYERCKKCPRWPEE